MCHITTAEHYYEIWCAVPMSTIFFPQKNTEILLSISNNNCQHFEVVFKLKISKILVAASICFNEYKFFYDRNGPWAMQSVINEVMNNLVQVLYEFGRLLSTHIMLKLFVIATAWNELNTYSSFTYLYWNLFKSTITTTCICKKYKHWKLLKLFAFTQILLGFLGRCC